MKPQGLCVAVGVLLLHSATARAESPVPAAEWTAETRLWLARSVLGEVGWSRPQEYAAVAWVYATRSNAAKDWSLHKMIRRYSAAVRSPGLTRQPWLAQLTNSPARPKSWPEGPRWENRYDKGWMYVLKVVDLWYAGKMPNPCPGANHFGGGMDAYRATRQGWYEVKCKSPMRNRFYDSRRTVRVARASPRKS